MVSLLAIPGTGIACRDLGKTRLNEHIAVTLECLEGIGQAFHFEPVEHVLGKVLAGFASQPVIARHVAAGAQNAIHVFEDISLFLRLGQGARADDDVEARIGKLQRPGLDG